MTFFVILPQKDFITYALLQGQTLSKKYEMFKQMRESNLNTKRPLSYCLPWLLPHTLHYQRH
jgi:hypothetical protein